jgi:hypothetical protein
MSEAPEKREEDRVGIRVFVDEGKAPGQNGLCRAVNVSRTGMYILRVPGNNQASAAKFAWLGFQLPDSGESIRALVEVVHTRRVGALEASGVRFKYLFPADRRRLEDYLERFAA